MNERLLTYLLEHGLLTAEQVDQLRDKYHNSGKSVRELLAESGAVSEENLLEAMSAVFKLPTVHLYEQQIPLEVRQLVRADLLRTQVVLPFAFDAEESDTILVAVNDPMNMRGRDLVAPHPKLRLCHALREQAHGRRVWQL